MNVDALARELEGAVDDVIFAAYRRWPFAEQFELRMRARRVRERLAEAKKATH